MVQWQHWQEFCLSSVNIFFTILSVYWITACWDLQSIQSRGSPLFKRITAIMLTQLKPGEGMGLRGSAPAMTSTSSCLLESDGSMATLIATSQWCHFNHSTEWLKLITTIIQWLLHAKYTINFNLLLHLIKSAHDSCAAVHSWWLT